MLGEGMRKLRVALQVILVPPAFAAAALGGAAAVAGQLGRRSTDFDLFNHFAPLWLAGGLVALLIAVLAQGWVRSALLVWGGVATLAAVVLVAPEFLRDTGPKAPADAPEKLKIVQLNSWFHNKTPTAIWTWLDSVDPDIVVLEETTDTLRRQALRRPGWHVTCGECEVMILSRRPPIRAQEARLYGPYPGPLTRAVFRDARGEFAVIGVHYAWPTDRDDQAAQEEGLRKTIAAGDASRTIVTGDFNSAPWSFARRRWDAKLEVIRRDRALFSWPAVRSNRFRSLGAVPILPIDHVYAGDAWATVKVERGPRVGSDHFPVVLTLAPVAPR